MQCNNIIIIIQKSFKRTSKSEELEHIKQWHNDDIMLKNIFNCYLASPNLDSTTTKQSNSLHI